MAEPLGSLERLRRIMAILAEEGIAGYLPRQYGVTLEREAEVIEIVRSSPTGKQDLPSYMLGVAPGASRENIERAARRIIEEIP